MVSLPSYLYDGNPYTIDLIYRGQIEHDIEHSATGRKRNLCSDYELTKDTLTGEQWGVFYEFLLEKIPRNIEMFLERCSWYSMTKVTYNWRDNLCLIIEVPQFIQTLCSAALQWYRHSHGTGPVQGRRRGPHGLSTYDDQIVTMSDRRQRPRVFHIITACLQLLKASRHFDVILC